MNTDDFIAIARMLAPEIEVSELSEQTATSQQAADAVGCDVGQICKSLVFLVDGQPLLVLMRGDRRVSTERLRELLGAERVKRADADTVKRATGYAIGGVPPFGHLPALQCVFDPCILEHEEMYAAAGGPHALFRMNSRRLLELSQGRAACVCELTS